MTDSRATGGLLQVIQESASEILQGCEEPAKEAGWILEATRELRRRGDTLVRREDFMPVAAEANHARQFVPGGDTDDRGFAAALERIESALGGSP